jgi:hypothetical protein
MLLLHEAPFFSQMLTVPSKLAAAMLLPEGDHVTQRMVLEWLPSSTLIQLCERML